MDDLDLSSMICPLKGHGVYSEPDYYCWGPSLISENSKYYMFYSRWPKSSGFEGWLTQSEIAVAESANPDGPYRHLKTILTGRGSGHWDELMVHNPKIKKFNDKYYLYHIGSRNGSTRGHIRDSQRTGVAVSDSLLGPYRSYEKPILEPKKPVYNITVNPGVTQMPDGRYLFVIKGDVKKKKPEEPMPQRIQAMVVGESPLGPFEFIEQPAIADIDTEDASLWYDSERRKYYAVFHAHTYIGLICSDDGMSWRRSENYKVTHKRIQMEDDSFLEPERLERPGVFMEEGKYKVLTMAIKNAESSFCILVPLNEHN